MAKKLPSGCKIAVLIESQYIPAEIEIYRTEFKKRGAEVHFMSRLWGNPSLTFISTVAEAGETPETLDVDIDFGEVDLDDYAAVVVSANYTSVRLRWFSDDDIDGGPVTAASSRQAPAVKFMQRAMRNRRIVKAALCHGLWALTPIPEMLAGRRVICNRVLLADVINAGGVYVPTSDGIVVDGDLVTGETYQHTTALVQAISEQILEIEANPPKKSATVPRETPRATERREWRILTLLSEFGYWGEELVGPLEEFDRAGYRVDFVTPTGRRPVAITVSMDPDYIDPPLGRSVTSPEMAAKVAETDDPTTEQGKRLEGPRDLSSWFPERPYWSAPQFVRVMEIYNQELVRAERKLEEYDALLIVGGSGPIVDLANSQRVHDLVLGFYRAGKPIAAECYGVSCLAFARDIETRKSIIWGKHVTGHCLEYDYKDGTGFMRTRGEFYDFNMGPPPYPLEYILRDATGPDGGYHGNFGEPTSVIVDYPFITGRSTPDSYLTGRKLVEALDDESPLRRWGW